MHIRLTRTPLAIAAAIAVLYGGLVLYAHAAPLTSPQTHQTHHTK